MNLTIFAAAISIMTVLGAGIGIAVATSKAVDAIARQPEAGGRIQTVLLLGAALSEATAIYALLATIMMLGKI